MNKQLIIGLTAIGFSALSSSAFAAESVSDPTTITVIELYRETAPVQAEPEQPIGFEKVNDLVILSCSSNCGSFVDWLRRTGLSRWSRRR